MCRYIVCVVPAGVRDLHSGEVPQRDGAGDGVNLAHAGGQRAQRRGRRGLDIVSVT